MAKPPLNQVNIHAAKTQLSKLVERAHRGEEIILAKNGKAYARLMPLQQPSTRVRPLGFLNKPLSDKSNAVLLEPLSEEELALWE